MRKIIAGLILLASTMTLWAERVSEEDAALVANHFMNGRTESSVQGVKKAAPAKRMVRKSVNNGEENQYYVYENANGEGWVIIAADDVVRPVLAYSETGHFRAENMPINVRKWMGKYNHFISRMAAENVVAGEKTKEQWRALRTSAKVQVVHTTIVEPLVQTQWDQDKPYNNLCPGSGRNKAYTGCVATAMAQVMKYWEWPIQGTGSHTYRVLDVNEPYDEYTEEPNYSTRYTQPVSADFENTTYDWDNMLDSYLYTTATSAQQTAIATLMFHCGVATEMMYGNDADGGSGTYTVNYEDDDEPQCAQNALWRHFKYNKDSIRGYMRDGYTYQGHRYYRKWSDTDWTNMIKTELNKRRPIMYSGASEEGGHSFICDGYDNQDYFHFNWGWSGDSDGFFLLSNLVPDSQEGIGGGGYDFSEDQDVIIGIVPDRPEAAGIEETKTEETATKMIHEGRVVIVRGGKMYSTTGQIIQ